MPLVDELSSAQKELVTSFSTSPHIDGGDAQLDLPSNPLLPLQVSLPDFSAWLAENSPEMTSEKGAIPTIIRFIADQPSARNAGLTEGILFECATKLPTLIVLDGFDEIGATKDRARLVFAARELLASFVENKVSAQILATTRPQGYAGELENIGIKLKSRYLTPLSQNEALEYAERLVSKKIQDSDLRQKTLARLREAAAEPATQRLLTTPLQVTILTALVQQLGRAPRERWNLFYRYFTYTYDREIERATYASRLLADYRSHIEKIHARVGLLLQVEAERDGGASARMTRKGLEDVIRRVLLEDEVADDELSYLVKDIAAAAEQRLVFLVEPEPNRFGFEIRSLQEFMAAWALSSGRDAEVEARLMQVAKAPMFRNVVLFMASRLFSEGSPLRDVLADDICGVLDIGQNDEPARITKVGGVLALETLEEGAVLAQPKRARALMQRAVRLLELPPNNEHPRLARIVNADTYQVLKQAIEGNFATGSNLAKFDSLSVCICLIVLTNKGDVWAGSKLFEVWSGLGDPASVLQVCSNLDIPISSNVAAIIEQLVPRLPMKWAVGLSYSSPAETGPGALLPWIASVYNSEPWERVSKWHLLTFADEFTVNPGPIVPKDSPLLKNWRTWIDVAEFQVNPSAETLATALEAVAESEDLADVSPLVWGTYWPLATCVNAASDAVDLRAFSKTLRKGLLGDIEDWKAAESNWNKRFRWTANMVGVLNSVPWSLESIKYAPPFCSTSQWRFIEAFTRKVSPSRVIPVLQQVSDAFEASDSVKMRAIFGGTCLILLRTLSSRVDVSEFPIEEWVRQSKIPLGFLVLRPRCVPQERWGAIINSLQPVPSRAEYFEGRDFLVLLGSYKVNGHLLRIAVNGLEGQTHIATGVRRKSSAHESALRAITSFEPKTKLERADLAIARIFLSDVGPNDVEELFDDIYFQAKNHVEYWNALIYSLTVSRASASVKDMVFVRAFQEVKGNYRQASRVVDALRDGLQARKSGLETESVWSGLGLPLPVPFDASRSRVAGAIPKQPVAIKSIKLRDVCGIHEIDFQLGAPDIDAGQWVVILGPNGVGKTTILRAIVVALRNLKNPAIWPKGTFSGNWNRIDEGSDASLVESKIEIMLSDGVSHQTIIRQGGSLNIAQFPEQNLPTLFPIFAYGCRRGSALGGVAREVKLNSDDGPEIATLFDEGADLIHAETWLIQLEGEAQKSKVGKQLYDTIIGALKTLLDVDSICVVEKRVRVKEHDKPSLFFSSLSDGYLTSVGWFIDLIARWITVAEREGRPVSDGFLSEMTGLVLIDEIDLHLHPRWQIEIISRTRQLLPKMSFVVTTHNPLTLIGAKAEEIWILASADRKVVARQGMEAPMLLTGGQIYRRYFGIEDVYPDELGKAMQRYSFLSGYAGRTDEEENELGNLISLLDKAGIRPQWEIVDRAKTVSLDNKNG
ncbi:AAA family ATPase [Burkholderia cenocepacia]|nr:AAA family ATPase [Burkholderia cenocepacia]